jgi:hypothetical protein
MPLRYSKSKWKTLADRARRRVVKKRLTHNDELLSKLERKAVRQLHSKMRALVPPTTARRPVPVLTATQEAWLRGIDCEAFSLEEAVKLYANREKK